MRSRKFIFMSLVAAGMIFTAPNFAAAEVQEVDENIYTWVQSTARANYYFNHRQINYVVNDDGFIDLENLVVPALLIYDDIQKEDVISKRRWNMKSRDGYDQLVGRADYLVFNLVDATVRVRERIDLDEQWGTLDTDTSGQPIALSSLPHSGVECKFYRAILEYAKKHNAEIIKHSWGNETVNKNLGKVVQN